MPSQHSRGQVHLALIALLAAVLLTLSASVAQAATYNVTTQADDTTVTPGDCVPEASSAGCSLREAVRAANLNPSNDQVNLPAGEYVLTNVNDNTDGSADLDVEGFTDSSGTRAGTLTILGAGARTTTIRSGGTDPAGTPVRSRIFELEGGQTFGAPRGDPACENSPGASLDVRDVRITRGFPDSTGGGIRVNDGANDCSNVASNEFDGRLSLLRVALTNNESGRDEGGGIFNSGETTIVDSLIASNSARGEQGGGIRSEDSLTVVNTTVAGNTAGGYQAGGGVSVSADAIEPPPGGDERQGRADLTNVTVVFNESTTSGGGLHVDGARQGTVLMNLKNTLVAFNRAGQGVNNCQVGVAAVSLGGNVEETDTCGFDGSVDRTNADVGLLSRANNGGSTDTYGLSADSDAVDAGTNAGCPGTDQRGVTRPQGARCDSGAFELVPAAAAAPAPASAPAPGTTATNTITTPVFVAFPRLLPERVTARVTKTRTGSGLRLSTRGRVTPPRGLTPGEACQFGIVTVSVKSGTRTVSTRVTQLEEDCTFSSTVTFRVRSRLGNRVLSVSARFIGNNRLLRRSAPRVSAGRP